MKELSNCNTRKRITDNIPLLKIDKFLLGEAFLVSVQKCFSLLEILGKKYTLQDFISENKTSTEHTHTKQNRPRLYFFSIIFCVFVLCFFFLFNNFSLICYANNWLNFLPLIFFFKLPLIWIHFSPSIWGILLVEKVIDKTTGFTIRNGLHLTSRRPCWWRIMAKNVFWEYY